MHKSPSFITISGLAGSGKSTVTEYLKGYFRDQGFSVNDFSFAAPLKDALCMWFDWDRQRLDSDFPYKEGSTLDDGSPDPYCEALGLTRRQAMQKFGTEAMRDGMHPLFWIILADLGVKLGKIPPSDIYVISDARMVNELEWAKSINAYRILVVREDIDTRNQHSSEATLTTHTEHRSEQEFMTWNKFSEKITNLIDENCSEQENKSRLFQCLNDFTIPSIKGRFTL